MVCNGAMKVRFGKLHFDERLPLHGSIDVKHTVLELPFGLSMELTEDKAPLKHVKKNRNKKC